jgi:shikimate kinase
VTEELALVGNMIVAPGGGWMNVPAVVALVRPPSRIVYLRVRPETALKRLGPMRMERPLLSRPDPLGELKRLFEGRRASYETADKMVDTELYSLQRVIEMVIELASVSG